jgi:DMSO/TMAO reductase YedYZ heme-binding membrane subunit
MPQRTIRWVLKPLAFAAGLLPFAWLIWAALTGNLSVNPLSDITLHTGDWAIGRSASSASRW